MELQASVQERMVPAPFAPIVFAVFFIASGFTILGTGTEFCNTVSEHGNITYMFSFLLVVTIFYASTGCVSICRILNVVREKTETTFRVLCFLNSLVTIGFFCFVLFSYKFEEQSMFMLTLVVLTGISALIIIMSIVGFFLYLITYIHDTRSVKIEQV